MTYDSIFVETDPVRWWPFAVAVIGLAATLYLLSPVRFRGRAQSIATAGCIGCALITVCMVALIISDIGGTRNLNELQADALEDKYSLTGVLVENTSEDWAKYIGFTKAGNLRVAGYIAADGDDVYVVLPNDWNPPG